MNKLTPMILAIIMLASTSLVALDWSELENNSLTEADGRSGPDAEVGDILSPRATTTDSITGEKLHTLKAGEDVHFETYIENVGDSAITEMGITVTVYLSEGGARGNIALDAAGNELSWTNGDVVCDDSFVCPWSSLGAGDLLDSGKYTMSYQGSPVTWTPITGDYVVVVSTDALGDADPGNDYAENQVSVVDWTDIIVDLAWDSGKEIEGGSGDKAFTLTVETGGSSSWSARGIQLELAVEGTLLTALDNDGTDIMGTNVIGDNSSATSGFGTYGSTTTWMHQDDANNTTSGERHVIDFQGSSTWNGVVSPDTSGESGDYSISVQMVSYVIFGQLPECEETTTPASGSGEEPQTFIHYCEVEMTQDDDAATSEDMIEGKVQTFHDIGVSALVINQGYTMDENNMVLSGPDNPGITEGPLNPAWSSVQASVRHLGSDIMVTYDWEVSFEIENIVSGAVHTEVADSCLNGLGDPYEHKELGDDMGMGGAFEMGEACIMFEFVPGIYDVTATVSMVGGAVGTEDMSARNDDSSIYEIAALNNRPSVTMTLEQQENSIVIGPEGFITLIADADDADDDTGISLNYVWTHPAMDSINGTLQPSICNGQGPAFSTCVLTAFDSAWAGTNLYSVRVSDVHGSYDQASMSVKVWNKIVATDTTDSGIGMEYDLTYNGANEFTVDLEDSLASYNKDLSDFGYDGSFSSVAVVDYTPSTTYMAEDVHAQTITMTYDASSEGIAPTGVFYVINGIWEELDTTIAATGNDGTIDIDMGAGNQVMPRGELVLMGGEMEVVAAPENGVASMVATASKGGDVTATWDYEGNVAGTWLQLEICSDDGEDCDSTKYDTNTTMVKLSGQTVTTHGVTYTFKAEICNGANGGTCHASFGTDSATADKMVDPTATATAMTVANKEGANAWTVSWTVDGDASDVAGWMVCRTDYSWMTSGEMPDNCMDAGDATTVDINHPGGQAGSKTYFFAAVPYDDKGNMDNAMPGTDIILTIENTVTDPCVEDPTGDECAAIGDTGDDAESGEVPTWTWGVIIGLIVVAFVVGAFILSRGGDGDEGKDWDY